MREIKFRVWDIRRKQFSVPLNLRPNIYDDGKDFEIYDDEFYVFQQYTGLKDKNGKEIYEGDIIEGKTYHYDEKVNDFVYSEIDKGHVWYINGSWNVSFNHLYSETSCHLEKFDLYSTEIIGNIYENPELLK